MIGMLILIIMVGTCFLMLYAVALGISVSETLIELYEELKNK